MPVNTYHSSREFALSSRNLVGLSVSSWESDMNSKDIVCNLGLVVGSSPISMLVRQMLEITLIWQQP